MERMPRSMRGVIALSALLAVPVGASAQDRPDSLRAPTIAASIAAAADWASTYHALKHYRVRETNPLLRPLDRSPTSVVAVGALIDAGAFTAWHMAVGRRNERAAAIGLWSMTAFRAFLVVHNVRNMRIAGRR